jgi:glucosyltransferase Lgt1/2/3
MSKKTQKPQFFFDPHRHVKVWFSNKPAVFMNTENQMRLIAMRDKNPKDEINLVFDSSLLDEKANKELQAFCKAHDIRPVDMVDVEKELTTRREKDLFKFYKDEVTHLKEGGNLGIASDIVRWLEPVYKLGTYTDFDVPVEVSELPALIPVQAPLLLNIGSLRLLGREMILSNNDFISIVDPVVAKDQIEKVQDAFIEKLGEYSSDYIPRTEAAFSGGAIKDMLLDTMRNRPEPTFMVKSNLIFNDGTPRTSRENRKYIQETMTNQKSYLDFKRNEYKKLKQSKPGQGSQSAQEETDAQVIERLRADLKKQLTFVRKTFFKKDYEEIKSVLKKNDHDLLEHLMKKERSGYLSAIVVCTTGPINIARGLFNEYVLKPRPFRKDVEPYSFKKYKLNQFFLSNNSMKLHENLIGMLEFLGAEEGKLNDSSWLETGAALQGTREEKLAQIKTMLARSLPYTLSVFEKEIAQHLHKIEKQERRMHTPQREAKIRALKKVQDCFSSGQFDVKKFRNVLEDAKRNKKTVFASSSKSKVKELFTLLDKVCHDAKVFSLLKDNKLSVNQRAVIELTDKKGKHAGTFFTPVESNKPRPQGEDSKMNERTLK